MAQVGWMEEIAVESGAADRIAPHSAACTDAQLLAGLLDRDEGRQQRAVSLLQRGGGWAGVRRLVAGPLQPPELGNGERRRLAHAFELTRRLLAESPSQDVLCDPKSVAERYRRLALEEAERLVAVGLDAGRRVLIEYELGGAVDGVHARPSDLLRPLIAAGAVAMIVVHNHPSRCREPSATDLAFTTRLAQAAALCGLELLDHVIIAGGQWTSLAHRGHLPVAHD